MQIGIDARMYGPKQTGIGNYIKYLIEYLARIDKANHYFIFLRKEEYSTSFQFPVSSFQKVLADFPWYSLAEQTAFLRVLSQCPLDIMHFPHFNVPLFYQKPFVVTIHDLTPKFFPGEKVGKSWLRRKAYDLVLRHAVKDSKAIITPSRFTKNDIIKHFPVDVHKIHVIHEGIPLTQLTATNYQLPVKVNPYILYVGVWRSHKNLEGLIKSFALVKKEGLPHKLVIVGDPDIYYERISRFWESLGLEGEVVAPGFQEEEALTQWYKRASLLVLPSLYEGFGLTPLTALSYSVPAAVSNIGALREILGDAAFYFNPEDPRDMARVIKKALTDKKSAKEKLSKSKALLRRYSWGNMTKKTLSIFEGVLR